MMPRPRVFVTRKIHPEVLENLAQSVELEVWQDPSPPPYSFLQEHIASMDGILTLLTDKIDAPLIQAGANTIKVISQMAVGYDNIDIHAATLQKIPVGHTPSVLTETTADMTWGLIMDCARRISEADREVRAGIWQPWGPDVLTGQDVYGATLGIIGFGRIGQAVARRARGFNMKILYTDISRNPSAEEDLGAEFVTFDELLGLSDFITLHVYLSEATRHLIGAGQFALMKPSAILINTARGPIVDPDALYQALKTGQISSAGLDVFDPEPIPVQHPILELPNVVIAPHIASASKQTRKRMAQMAAENLLAGLQGQKIPYCVNPDVYN